LQTESRDGTVTVRLTERDIAHPEQVHAEFERLIFQEGFTRIAADLSEVTGLTSLMIGTLVSLHLLAYENVVVLTFKGLSRKLVSLLEMVGLSKLMEAHYPDLRSGR
jgi:anti-anti-sigma regulatory factor